MKNETSTSSLSSVWRISTEPALKAWQLLYLCLWGCAIGMAVGAVISLFRIISHKSYTALLEYASLPAQNFCHIALFFVLFLATALFIGYLIRNPFMRFGGTGWRIRALAHGQPHPWLRILLPKFIGTCLVMGLGVSVGRGGPCVQMGAATALGFGRLHKDELIKRRFFMLGGCSAGLSADFGSPFSGVAYVYEVMKEKLDPVLFIFLLSGSVGVYAMEMHIFDLGYLLPFGSPKLPDLLQSLWLLPLGLLSGIVGSALNYAILGSMKLYSRQKLLSPCLRPVAVFMLVALMFYIFPALTGEGLSVLASLREGNALLGYLCFFLCAKLLFTAFCFGSGIPAGLMEPLLCLGGVTGGIYGAFLVYIGAISPELVNCLIVMGMAGAYACAEQAPITALLLVLGMTGTWEIATPMLLVVAIAFYCGRVARVRVI